VSNVRKKIMATIQKMVDVSRVQALLVLTIIPTFDPFILYISIIKLT
jgi:hypothetical protein